ncbi:MAG: tetratricopeptide repeat protein [Vulcanimicrobiota bacterium]
MREVHLKRLEELYGCLEERPGNPCGQCRECCTDGGANLHRVTELELDLIEERVGPVEDFRRYLARTGEFHLCPFYDEQARGCGIYAVRPFSCRIFGHYRSDATRLPEVCVFRGQERIFGSYFEEVPQARQLRELVRDYWPHRQQRVSLGQPTAPGPDADPLEQALWLQHQGHFDEALAQLESADLSRTPYFLYCLALILEGLGQFAPAQAALEEALEAAPEVGTLWFRLGCVRFSRGLDAVAAFDQACRFDPDNGRAWGFLGCAWLQKGCPSEAVEPLRRAVEMIPEEDAFARYLALATGSP